MKLREWILEGYSVDGTDGNWVKMYTTPFAPISIAVAKLELKVPKDLRFCVKLVKGKIIDLP